MVLDTWLGSQHFGCVDENNGKYQTYHKQEKQFKKTKGHQTT